MHLGQEKIMKKVRVEDAVGMTLCHDITAMYDGFKGAAFSRGHIISKGFLILLQTLQISQH